MKLLLSISVAVLAVAAPAFAHEAREAQGASHTKPNAVQEQKKPQAQQPTRGQQHSGGTDANGCHTNHSTGEYHCHKPK